MKLPIKLSIRIKNNSNENDCYIRKCISDDYSQIIEIQDTVMAELEKNGKGKLFMPTEKEQIKHFLGNENVYFLCVDSLDGICAYSYTFFSQEIECDLSCHFVNKKVATFDTVVVLSDFRGNNIHDKLSKIIIEEAKERNCDIVAATVSPDNIHSLNNLIKNGFEILKIIEDEGSYKGYKRYIMYKKLTKEELK